MTRFSRDLEEFRDDALSPEVKAEFAASDRAVEAWERENPTSIEGILDWIDQLRAAFGDPEPDRTPWRGDDFKID
jgi:hypothetical protein